jgi:hypothetical protein
MTAARLQSAYRLWQTVEAPYESARSRAALADAHLKQGDLESCSLELNAAISMFERLGALPDRAFPLTVVRARGLVAASSRKHSQIKVSRSSAPRLGQTGPAGQQTSETGFAQPCGIGS